MLGKFLNHANELVLGLDVFEYRACLVAAVLEITGYSQDLSNETYNRYSELHRFET